MQCAWGVLHGRAQRARIGRGVNGDAERERFVCLTRVQARKSMWYAVSAGWCRSAVTANIS